MLGSKSDISTIDKITFDDFVDMVNNQKWDHEYDSETSGPIADYYDIPSFNHTCNDYLMHNPMKKATLSGYSGSLSMNSTLDEYSVYFERDITYIDCLPETFTFKDEAFDRWQFNGFIVIDDNGHQLSNNELAKALPTSFSDVSINVKDFMDCEHHLIHIDSSKPKEVITLEGSFSKDIAFSGELVAEVTSSSNKPSQLQWSDELEAVFTLKLYKTIKDTYICYRKKEAAGGTNKDIHEWQICKNKDDVTAFFGTGWLANELYVKAGN